MLDGDIVHVSPSTTYRVLVAAGVLTSKVKKPSKKGKGFHQPDAPHRHWHIDITYIKIKGVFYYLILVLDGYSRYVVAWDLRDRMTVTGHSTPSLTSICAPAKKIDLSPQN
jgi:transposase InsO family protein